MTQEYLRAIAGSGLGRVGLLGNLLLVRLHGTDGPIQIVHDHSGARRTDGELLLVAPTQEAPGLTGYRVVGPPVLDYIYVNDNGNLLGSFSHIYMVDPVRWTDIDLGFPGFLPGYLAAAGGWVCITGGPTESDIVMRDIATDWITIPTPTNVDSAAGHHIHTLAFANALHLIYRADAVPEEPLPTTVRIYRLDPPSTTLTEIARYEIASDQVILRCVTANRRGPYAFVCLRTEDHASHSVIRWDGTTWTALTLPQTGSNLLIPENRGRMFFLSPDDLTVYVSTDNGDTWTAAYAVDATIGGVYAAADQATHAIVNGEIYAAVSRQSLFGNLPDGYYHFGPASSPTAFDRSYLIHLGNAAGSSIKMSTSAPNEISGIVAVNGVPYFSTFDSTSSAVPYVFMLGIHDWLSATANFGPQRWPEPVDPPVHAGVVDMWLGDSVT